MNETPQSYEAAPFDPESCPLSQELTGLTLETDETVVRETFIRWSKEVLAPMMEDIISAMEQHLEEMRELRGGGAIRSRREDPSDIESGIATLQKYLAYYDKLLNEISEATSFEVFLNFMGTIDAKLDLNWLNVSYGMNDARISERYSGELYPAVCFRYNEARRLLTRDGILYLSNIDDAVRPVYLKYESDCAVSGLDQLGKEKTQDAYILSEFWHSALQPALADFYWYCKDNLDYTLPNFDELFGCPSREGGDPPPMRYLLAYFSELSSKLAASLEQMDPEIAAQEEVQAHVANLQALVGKLVENLGRMTTD